MTYFPQTKYMKYEVSYRQKNARQIYFRQLNKTFYKILLHKILADKQNCKKKINDNKSDMSNVGKAGTLMSYKLGQNIW